MTWGELKRLLKGRTRTGEVPSWLTEALTEQEVCGQVSVELPARRSPLWRPAWYTSERIADQGKRWWLGVAWVNHRWERVLLLPWGLHVAYRGARGLFEYLYWPIADARRGRLIYSILRRSIRPRECEKTGQTLQYCVEDLQKLLREIEGKTYKNLQEVHKEWVGY
jgi:hypothetical protein